MPRYTCLQKIRKIRKNERAISPAISTVIITSAVIVLLLVVVGFANNFLNGQLATNEFNTMQQSMQTVGLQVDDVAWTIGRTQTIKYSSQYGAVRFESLALNYSVYLDTGSGYGSTPVASYPVGVLLFNMPTSSYSIGNNYFQKIFPSSNSSFLQIGTTAPICHIFAIEKMPMNDGNFARVAVAPSVRMINSTMTNGGVSAYYFRFYLSVLKAGPTPRYTQSITLMGNSTSLLSEQNAHKIKIAISFPKAGLGFDSSFFNFQSLTQEVTMPNGSVAQIYAGSVIVSLGVFA